jgi:hypothetical protein
VIRTIFWVRVSGQVTASAHHPIPPLAAAEVPEVNDIAKVIVSDRPGSRAEPFPSSAMQSFVGIDPKPIPPPFETPETASHKNGPSIAGSLAGLLSEPLRRSELSNSVSR